MVARTRAGGNPLGTLGRGRLKGQTGRQPRAITRKSIPNRDWPLALTPVWVLRQAASLAPCHPRRPGSRGGVDDIVGTCLADALNDARQRQTVCPEELESHHQAVPHALRVGKPAPPVHGPEKYFGVNLDDARISGERLDLEDPPAKSVTLLGNGGTQVAHNLHRFTVISRLQGPTRRREKHAVAPAAEDLPGQPGSPATLPTSHVFTIADKRSFPAEFHVSNTLGRSWSEVARLARNNRAEHFSSGVG
jgi:hypothetical protein